MLVTFSTITTIQSRIVRCVDVETMKQRNETTKRNARTTHEVLIVLIVLIVCANSASSWCGCTDYVCCEHCTMRAGGDGGVDHADSAEFDDCEGVVHAKITPYCAHAL